MSQKRYRYTGMEKDEETGLSYHHHRYYATWLGRWTSSDPIGLGGGINRFAYCQGNPTCGVDANGHGSILLQFFGDSPRQKSDEEKRVDHVYDTAYEVGLAHGQFEADAQHLWSLLPADKLTAKDRRELGAGIERERAKLPKLPTYPKAGWNQTSGQGFDSGYYIGLNGRQAETFLVEQAEWAAAGAAADAATGGSLGRSVARSGAAGGGRRYRAPLNAGAVARTVAGVEQIADGLSFGGYADVRFAIGRAVMFDEGSNAAYMLPRSWDLTKNNQLVDPRKLLLSPEGEWFIRINPSVLSSDVALAATLQHEATEIAQWSRLLEDMDARGAKFMKQGEFLTKLQSFHNLAMDDEYRVAMALGAEPVP